MSAANNFHREFKIPALEGTFDKYVSNTSAIGIDRITINVFESKLTEELNLINRKVLDGSYNFSQYQEKLISKGASKLPRVISIPTCRDRIVLRSLCNVLSNTFVGELAPKIPQHVIADIKKELKSGKYQSYIKIDIDNFYPSINHENLFSILKRRVRKEELSTLIRKAISTQTVPFPKKSIKATKRGVPQGLAISNVLAEIYLSAFDKWLHQQEGIAYFRYVDDILIFCNENPEQKFKEIEKKLADYFDLKAHKLGDDSKSKIGSVNDSFFFLGYQFSKSKAGVKEESILRLESSLAKIFTTYKYKTEKIKSLPESKVKENKLALAQAIFFWRLNLRITGCIFEGSRKGWIFYYSQIDEANVNQLKKIDGTVKKLALRFKIKFIEKKSKIFSSNVL